MVTKFLAETGRTEPKYVSVVLNDAQRYGTGGALKSAEALYDDNPILLVYGDTYLDIDYQDFLEFSAGRRAEVAMVAYNNHDLALRGNLNIGNDDVVLSYRKGADRPEFTFVDAGVATLARQVISDLPSTMPLSYEENVLPTLVNRRAVVAYKTQQRFHDIGTPDGLNTFSRLVKMHDTARSRGQPWVTAR
jgi:NDP-sugar pyrophosphorylase family protein